MVRKPWEQDQNTISSVNPNTSFLNFRSEEFKLDADLGIGELHELNAEIPLKCYARNAMDGVETRKSGVGKRQRDGFRASKEKGKEKEKEIERDRERERES
eukprot:TRINITY_DN8619_c0_g1_i3.p1 TRINITY_DN8619_c0_g1~~TRINITY_DN8619_c0_g1_i3.p1  ORF type:complete len:101 (-),score=30.06 TRINITY_DN8619_c0_g1_i3:42-344(-)